ncbi:MAG TPA: hypothetical protein VK610_05990, partial [Rhodothermales bacterium]|nr:hypothetical protein [Rhodothermales bacterium]
VVGVVVGFQVSAWGQGRADLAREAGYLEQLGQDAQETVRRMDEADSALAPVLRAHAQLLRAYRRPEAPPRDSVLTWLGRVFNFEAPAPVVATAEAIAQSGDLALIRDDSLRRALPAYLERSDTRRRDVQADVVLFGQAFVEGTRRYDPWAITSEAASPSHVDSVSAADDSFALPAGPRTSPFPLVVGDLLRDRELYHALYVGHVVLYNLRRSRAGAREEAEALLHLIQTAQAR